MFYDGGSGMRPRLDSALRSSPITLPMRLEATKFSENSEKGSKMALELTGKHLIAGEWKASGASFKSEPMTGEPREFSTGTPELVDAAVKAAVTASGCP